MEGRRGDQGIKNRVRSHLNEHWVCASSCEETKKRKSNKNHAQSVDELGACVSCVLILWQRPNGQPLFFVRLEAIPPSVDAKFSPASCAARTHGHGDPFTPWRPRWVHAISICDRGRRGVALRCCVAYVADDVDEGCAVPSLPFANF